MLFIDGASSPTGNPLLLVGYEGVGTEATRGIGVYAVPEPSSAALLTAGALGFLARRRRQAR